MKKIFCCTILSFFILTSVLADEWVDYVNPLMGTESTFEFSYGNTYPAVAVPWGMNFWSPQTGKNNSGWMYSYADKEICGFRQTHQPSPWINDYGTFSIMPVSGELRIGHEERKTTFSHQNEMSSPYFYGVTLDNGIFLKLSATSRGAIFNINYPKDKKKYLIVDAYNGGCGIRIDADKKRISGYTKSNNGGVPSNFANYFVMEFNHAIVRLGTTTNGVVAHGKPSAEHHAVCAYVEFDSLAKDDLVVRVASSFISEEQAWRNFEQEVKDKSFDQLSKNAKEIWNGQLGKIKVAGGTEEQRRIFYSCLYRTLLFPREFFEYDSLMQPMYYSPYDGKIHQGYMYTDNGFWDTFRAVHPLFTLIYPEVSERIMPSLLNAYRESGFLPEWASPGHRGCMIGNNSLSLLTDAWMKGIRGFDAEKALEAMEHQTKAQGRESSVGRNGFEEYHRLGYVPYPDYPEAAAKTLEYAYADWCLYRFAEAVGNDRLKTEYKNKCLNYKNLFDSSVGFMRAKNKAGKWIEPFDAVEWGGPFTEGCSWHYTWSVFHDVEGLSQLMGGHSLMAQKLDSMFSAPNTFNYGTYGFVIHEIAEMVALNMGQYAHGNQPIQHAIYLYNYLRQPWKSQQRVREVMNKLYNSSPKGYCGDEDNGQTSAWYVFSAMGFYPVCPGTSEYVLGSPLFERIEISLPNKNVFEIRAKGNSSKNVYIKKAQLNGTPFYKNYLRHDEILKGGLLNLKMDSRPNIKRGINNSDLPYSFSR